LYHAASLVSVYGVAYRKSGPYRCDESVARPQELLAVNRPGVELSTTTDHGPVCRGDADRVGAPVRDGEVGEPVGEGDVETVGVRLGVADCAGPSPTCTSIELSVSDGPGPPQNGVPPSPAPQPVLKAMIMTNAATMPLPRFVSVLPDNRSSP
jgi:hypothetical protein